MRRVFVAFFALLLVGLGLAGCGLFRFEQREPWRTQAEEACLSQRLVQPSAYMALSSKIDGPGVCGMDYPFKVSAFGNGSVGLTSKVTLACPIVSQIDTWLDEIVKPAALLYFGVPLADLRAGSYSCRPRNNQRGAKVSEHAFGNAMDVMAFVLADGRRIAVDRGWKGDPAEQGFLREVFVGACRYFNTVLGPRSDSYHSNHLHIDLARHDPRGTRRICKPILQFTAQIDPDRSRGASPAAGPMTAGLERRADPKGRVNEEWTRFSAPNDALIQEGGIGMQRSLPGDGVEAAPAMPVPQTPARVGYAADLPITGAYPSTGPSLRPMVRGYGPAAVPPVTARAPLALNGAGIY